MKNCLAIGAAALLSSPLAHSASFDCTKASTFVEKAICSDPKLSRQDEVLGENYKYMSASNIGDGARKDLKATQRTWIMERNKCTDNECITNAYRKRIDEICDYPVVSGVHPTCVSAEEVEAEFAPKKQQAPLPKNPPATQGATQQNQVKNSQKIDQLKLPASFVNATLYVNYLGQWVEFMPVKKWLGLLLENKKIESLQHISANGNSGVSIKRQGRPSVGLLFRTEGKEAYVNALVVSDEVLPIKTPSEHSQVAVLMKSLTNEEMMD